MMCHRTVDGGFQTMARYKEVDMSSRFLAVDLSRQVVSGSFEYALSHLEFGADNAVLRVRDNGAGIAPDRLEWIFELFTQANPTLARTEGGLGIGLTVAKRLVELHKGRIRATSEGWAGVVKSLWSCPWRAKSLCLSHPPRDRLR
jgi:hypothetical protein